MSRKLILVIVAILCVCLAAGCFLEQKTPDENKPDGPVVLDSTPGLEDNETDMTITDEAETGEPVAIQYITPDGQTPPEGYEPVTPEKDIVLGSLDYPVYSFTDSNGYTRYTALGQIVDAAGNACSDPAWYVFISRTVARDDAGKNRKQYVFRDAYDQIGLLPAEAVVAEEDDLPFKVGFTVYSVETADAAGNYSRTYYAYADIYDADSPGAAESGWQQVAVADEAVPEDAYGKLIKGQKAYLHAGDGSTGVYEIGAGMTLKPDFSKDTVTVKTWDIIVGAGDEILQSEDAKAEMIITGETTEDLNKPEEKEEEKKEEEEKKQEEEKKEEEKKEEEKKDEEKKDEEKKDDGKEEDSDDGIDKHEHNWKEIDRCDQTCIDKGYVVYECTICGTKKEETLKADGVSHDFDITDKTDPTCTTDGKTVYTCNFCGKEEVKTTPAAGHSWVIKSDGSGHWKECTECATSTTLEPHVFADGVCTVCGYEAKG